MSIQLKSIPIEIKTSLCVEQDFNQLLNIESNKNDENSETNKNSIDIIINNNNSEMNVSSKKRAKNNNNLIENRRKSLRKLLPKNSHKKIFKKEFEYVSNELQKDIEISKLRKENQNLQKTCELLIKENHLLREELTKNGLNSSHIIIGNELDLIYDKLLNGNNINNNKIQFKVELNNGKILSKSNDELNPINEQSIDNEFNVNKSESLALSSSEEISDNLTVIKLLNKNENNLITNNGDKRKKVRQKIHLCLWPGCERKFSNKYHLQRHELTHSGEKPFKCDFNGCNFATRDEYSLGVHKRQHTGERPFKCTHPGCKFRAAQSGNLMSHKLKHTGEMPFMCDWPGCQQFFRFRSTYVYHKKVHINDKSFICSFGCGKSFIYRNDLKNHEAIHTGERKYLCSWPGCDKTYIQKNGLNNHLKWHTGDRRFGCDWPGCDWKSLSSHGLIKHKKTHTGERPFPCDRCDRKFADESNLKAHQRVVHDKERRFVCSFDNCSKSFTVRRLLVEHQQKEKHQ